MASGGKPSKPSSATPSMPSGMTPAGRRQAMQRAMKDASMPRPMPGASGKGKGGK